MNELLATLWDNMEMLQFIKIIVVLIWTITKEVLIFIVLIMAIRLMWQKLKENKVQRKQEQEQKE